METVQKAKRPYVRWDDLERKDLSREMFRRNVKPDSKDFMQILRSVQKKVLPESRQKSALTMHSTKALIEAYKTFYEAWSQTPIIQIVQADTPTALVSAKEEPEHALSSGGIDTGAFETLVDLNRRLLQTIAEMKTEFNDKVDFLCDYISALDRDLRSEEVPTEDPSTASRHLTNLKLSVVKKRVVILGPNNDQQNALQAAFDGYFDIRCFYRTNVSIRQSIQHADIVIMMTKFARHALFHTVKAFAKDKLILANGGTDSVRQILNRYVPSLGG